MPEYKCVKRPECQTGLGSDLGLRFKFRVKVTVSKG